MGSVDDSILSRLQGVHAAMAAACGSAGRSPSDVALLAVSKRHPETAIRAALDAGQSAFGENRVQELVAKAAALKNAVLQWHMIGSLQTNKVRELLAVNGLVCLHSLDRAKLARALQRELVLANRVLPCLLQIDATGDENKQGVVPEAALELAQLVISECPRIQLAGLMAMGPLNGDPQPVFTRVAKLRDELREELGLALPELSMGMTDDMDVAIAAGSTMVRVGTGVFGQRP